MSMPRTAVALLLAALSALCISASGAAQTPAAAPTTPPKPVYSHTPSVDDTYQRDPDQPVDQAYTDAIKRYTTDPQFSSPLVDYLPASSTVPTPMKTLGVIAGAPDVLPYAEDVYAYFRALAAASPRVKVITIGHTEEGREMIAVAIADESLLNDQKANDARLAQLADPRSIGLDDAKAKALIAQSVPVYYITGTIHSSETGAPTALMEMAYRLAVDDSPYIKNIRSKMIVLITPVVEVDGRDRMVDLYRWHKAHPGEEYPRLMYWGHYVAHDNNRDAMGMTPSTCRATCSSTYLGWHAQVLHDLHESVPFLYDDTVGDGPYNAWIDPIVADEVARARLEQRRPDAGLRHARGVHPRRLRHLVAGLSDVPGRHAQWNEPAVRNLRQRRRRHRKAYPGSGGIQRRTWYLAEPAAAGGDLVATRGDNNNYEQSAHCFRRCTTIPNTPNTSSRTST